MTLAIIISIISLFVAILAVLVNIYKEDITSYRVKRKKTGERK